MAGYPMESSLLPPSSLLPVGQLQQPANTPIGAAGESAWNQSLEARLDKLEREMRREFAEILAWRTEVDAQLASPFGRNESDTTTGEFLGGNGKTQRGLREYNFEAREVSLERQVSEDRLSRPEASSLLSEDSGKNAEHISVNVIDQDADLEAANHDYKRIVRHAKHEYDLNLDVWAAMTFVIVKDFPIFFAGNFSRENLLRTFVVLSSMVLNLFLQFMFLYWASELLMLPNVQKVQETYKTFHRDSFISGRFDARLWASFGKDDLDRICGLPLSTTLFLSACLFLWVARCFNEIRDIFARKMSLDTLPELPSGVSALHMVHDVSLQMGKFSIKNKHCIVCLNSTARLTLDLLIVLPRTLVALLLLMIGVGFLTSSESLSDLIFNSLAMAFIFDIDELIFKAFLPNRIKEDLIKTKIITPPDSDLLHLSGKQLDIEVSKIAYRRSICYFCCVSTFMVAWLVFQPIIPGYEHDISTHCVGYREQVRQISCQFWQRDCFPK